MHGVGDHLEPHAAVEHPLVRLAVLLGERHQHVEAGIAARHPLLERLGVVAEVHLLEPDDGHPRRRQVGGEDVQPRPCGDQEAGPPRSAWTTWTSVHRFHICSRRSARCMSTLGILRSALRSGRSGRGTAPERRSSSALARTPGGNDPKNGSSTERLTLSSSTSYPWAARYLAWLRAARIVPPPPRARDQDRHAAAGACRLARSIRT